MSIDTYVGVPGIAIDVENVQELYEALDALHTQVMDNMDDHPLAPALLDILGKAMDGIQDIDPNVMS